MADDQGVRLSEDAAKRMRDATLFVESMPRNGVGNRRQSAVRPASWVWVTITGKAAGAGKYNGKVVYEPDIDVDPETGVSLTDLGAVDSDEDEVLIVNLVETGGGGWILWEDPDGDPDNSDNSTLNPPAFPGTIRRINDDGTVVVAINGFRTEMCSTGAE